jgi:site-specific DNA recombinase
MIGIYVRVSSSNQVVDGISIDIQKQIGINFADSLGEGYRIYEDGGLSGGSIEKRKSYQNLVCDIENGEIDKVWVRDLSRLNRDLKNSLEFRFCLKKNKTQLFEDGRIINFDNEQDVLLLDIMNVVSEYHRKYSGTLSSTSKIKMLSDGKYVFGGIPFGYKRENDKLVVNNVDVDILNIIWNCAIEGMSLRKIRTEIILKYGNDFMRNGKKLTFQNMWLNRIIKNELYYSGLFKIKFKDREYEFEVEKLIDYDRWNRILEEYSGKIKLRRIDKINVLEGKICCSGCNNKMYFYAANGYKRKDGIVLKKYYYCMCGNEKCEKFKKNGIEEKLLMKDFMVFFNKIKNSDKLDLVEEFKERINYLYDEQKNNLVGFNRKGVVKKIEDLEEKRDRLKYLFMENDLERKEYEELKFEISKEINIWENKLREEGKIYDDKLIKEYLNHIQKISGNKSDSYIVNNLINKIYVRKVKRDWFEGGFRIFYKIDWNFLGRLDNKLKLLLFVSMSIIQKENVLYKLDLLRNKDKVYKRNIKIMIEFYVDNFKIIIVDCYLEDVFD